MNKEERCLLIDMLEIKLNELKADSKNVKSFHTRKLIEGEVGRLTFRIK